MKMFPFYFCILFLFHVLNLQAIVLVQSKYRCIVSPLSLSMNTNRDNICPNFDKCSGEYRTKGCDGSGKIQGGIATIPGFRWWPIKVFRPCPSYLEAGYIYRREGQTMDQVLFSEPSSKMKEKILAESRRVELLELERQKEELMRQDINEISGDINEDAEKFLNEKFNKKD